MINILEDKLHRKIKMIDLLIENQTGISLDTISKRLDISKSTIQRDVDLLNSTYKEYIYIENDQNNLFLLKSNTEELSYLKHLIISESINLMFLSEVLFSPFNKIKFYSDKFDVSSSNIYKMIKQINQSLSSYQIEIVNVNNKYFLQAHSEITLRRLFSVFWMELNYFDVKSIENNDYIKNIGRHLTIEFESNVKLVQLYNVSFMYISYIREIQFFHLDGELKEDSHDCINKIESVILESLLYSPFINNHLFYSRKLYRLKEFLNDNIVDSKKADLLHRCLVIIYHNECSDQIPWTIFINKYQYFYLSLKEKSHLYQPVKEAILAFSNILEINLEEYQSLLSYLLVVYFPELLANSDKKTVYVYSNLSTSHAFFLQKTLTDRFSNLYEFIIVKDRYFFNNNQDGYLFVTNEQNFISKNNFVINDFPKQIDLANLEIKLNNFYYPKNI